MSESPEPNRVHEQSPKAQERDPYPRMILVCMGIALVLVMIIFAFIFFDFMNRGESGVRPVRPTATQPLEVSNGG